MRSDLKSNDIDYPKICTFGIKNKYGRTFDHVIKQECK